MDYENLNELKRILIGNNYNLTIKEKTVSLNVKFTKVDMIVTEIAEIIKLLKKNFLHTEVREGYSKKDFDKHINYRMIFFSDKNQKVFRTYCKNPELSSTNGVYTLIDDYNVLKSYFTPSEIAADDNIGSETQHKCETDEEFDERKQNPLDIQIDGSHYKNKGIQPVEYAHANGLDFFQGNVVKYITRFREKNGKADLEKAKHYLELLIHLEYKNE